METRNEAKEWILSSMKARRVEMTEQDAEYIAWHFIKPKIDYTCLKCKSRQNQNKSNAWCDECIGK